jgi:hypothetical protein
MRTPGEFLKTGPLRDIFGAVGQVAGSAIQAGAAETAASDQLQAAQQAIALQQSEFNTTQTNEAPWLAAGGTALGQLTQGTAPGGSLVTPYGATYQTPAAFVAPTGVTEQNDPGYQFQLQQGEQALARGAAASGGAFSGGTMQALTRYGQNQAQSDYQNVYNNALAGYQTNVNTGLNAYNTQFNAYNTAQTNQYNRLASLAGLGQTAVGQLANAGQAAASNSTNLITQGGTAASAGALGLGGALNSGIQNSLNTYQNGALINALTGGSGGGGGGVYDPSLSLTDPTALANFTGASTASTGADW